MWIGEKLLFRTLRGTPVIEDTSKTLRGRGAAAGFTRGQQLIVALIAAGAAVGFLFADALRELELLWRHREEYSHGYLVPVVSLFLIWHQRYEIAQTGLRGSWLGWWVLLGGLTMFVMGHLGTLYVVQHYAFAVVLFGLAWSFAGTAAMRYLWFPLVFLLFMVPLPPFLYNNLSGKLQLISSELGVAIIRWLGISVFLEGNVIDLGTYKLQVVEACNGLRYLFPLTSFGFLAAYLFRAPLWQRAIVFLSTIPITVLMNSFRIGITGVLVDRFGIGVAEGFLHDFEGWVIFMACTLILLTQIWFFARFTGGGQPLSEVFGLVALPSQATAAPSRGLPKTPAPFAAAIALVLVVGVVVQVIGARPELIPERTELARFPGEIDGWIGSPQTLEQHYLDALDLTDYYIGDFHNPLGEVVNFYTAYYASQRSGEAAHSPRSCIPGGGWEISDLSRQTLAGVQVDGQNLVVNRLQIQRGDARQLVYYWFQGRSRLLTSEYAVKWYLFWDALTRNRTDGALVRITTGIKPWEDWARGDKRLSEFAGLVVEELGSFVPN